MDDLLTFVFLLPLVYLYFSIENISRRGSGQTPAREDFSSLPGYHIDLPKNQVMPNLVSFFCPLLEQTSYDTIEHTHLRCNMSYTCMLISRRFRGYVFIWLAVTFLSRSLFCYFLFRVQFCFNMSTVKREFFGSKIFRRLNFHLAIFLSLWPLDHINLLHLYIKKYFVGLIFVVEGDRQKFFRGENFLVYGTSYFASTVFPHHSILASAEASSLLAHL